MVIGSVVQDVLKWTLKYAADDRINGTFFLEEKFSICIKSQKKHLE